MLRAWPSSAGKPWNGTDPNGPIALAATVSGCDSGVIFEHRQNPCRPKLNFSPGANNSRSLEAARG